MNNSFTAWTETVCLYNPEKLEIKNLRQLINYKNWPSGRETTGVPSMNYGIPFLNGRWIEANGSPISPLRGSYHHPSINLRPGLSKNQPFIQLQQEAIYFYLLLSPPFYSDRDVELRGVIAATAVKIQPPFAKLGKLHLELWRGAGRLAALLPVTSRSAAPPHYYLRSLSAQIHVGRGMK
ncbi:hypothetical protein J6590_010178 [Homalodisca vitripennis]|nr:hypothetical protein J6590_010178 [Homalodisca vitripennis]